MFGIAGHRGPDDADLTQVVRVAKVAAVTTGVSAGRRGRRGAPPPFDADFVARWLRASAAEIALHRDFLTQLDAAIGDADHGVNMDRGFAAVVSVAAAADGLSPGELLVQAGATLVLRVGGAAGPLFGSALREAGRSLGDASAFGLPELTGALDDALAAIVKLGAAEEGDKTIVDAWTPALRALRDARSAGAVAALHAARVAAEAGAAATTPMEARKGRASYLGPRSVGHQDPGAASTSLLFGALERAAEETPRDR
jgi:phosphoenolpyruvate---glycerone phosphotransferase subunit DhaL